MWRRERERERGVGGNNIGWKGCVFTAMMGRRANTCALAGGERRGRRMLGVFSGLGARRRFIVFFDDEFWGCGLQRHQRQDLHLNGKSGLLTCFLGVALNCKHGMDMEVDFGLCFNNGGLFLRY
jgi:hypothetical protein